MHVSQVKIMNPFVPFDSSVSRFGWTACFSNLPVRMLQICRCLDSAIRLASSRPHRPTEISRSWQNEAGACCGCILAPMFKRGW